MIRFFRQIRQRLLVNNNISRYLFYTIGEILLVVIGILIALQVDSWNQQRLERKEEQQILSNLHEEFLQNKAMIGENMNGVREILANGQALMNLIGAEEAIVRSQNTDSLLFHFLPALDLSTSGTSLQNVIQSGKMNLITNKMLINALYQWEALLDQVKQREQFGDEWTNNIMLPMMAEYISFKEMDAQGDYSWTGKSRLANRKMELFQSLVFENYLDNSLYLQQNLIIQLEKAEALATEIISLTRTE
ncbi:hypothetical protein ACT6NV_06815 [Robiginitalea sp. IMCC44478]|uniref:hypothetical protein n=1 Tax=Robiginitalea sp. IMCC44478 TaxID=3459122 RepID=UPI0040416521